MNGWYVFTLVVASCWFVVAVGALAWHAVKKSWEDRREVLSDVAITVAPLIPIVLILVLR